MGKTNDSKTRTWGDATPPDGTGVLPAQTGKGQHCDSPWCDATSDLSTRVRYTTTRGIHDTYCARCWADIDEADRVMGTGDPMERAR